MNYPALQTLFYAFENELLAAPSGDVLFINAQDHDYLKTIDHLTLEQHFAPYAKDLMQKGYDVQSHQADVKKFDAVLLLGTKNVQETRFHICRALEALKDGGLLVCAAANDAGGKRLGKDLKTLGLEIEDISKHKCRVVWAHKTNDVNTDVLDQWQSQGDVQDILDGAFKSQPGLFSWDRADKGSQFLLDYLATENISKKGADFGCGYGFLSKNILQMKEFVTALDYIDADSRAVKVCEENIKGFNAEIRGVWHDLTQKVPNDPAYNFILMNPPFHEGKKTAAEIGQAFIRNAYLALKRGGVLYMVANAHLPYEKIVAAQFKKFDIIEEKQGFKIIKAVR
jgi:16S rRNA (guanine1207-N2)-methyltransferase